jgi:C-terminal processing protease CtpA/Prc
MAVEVTADRRVSGLLASRASLQWMDREGRRLVYIHLWNLLSSGASGLLEGVLETGGDYAEGLIVDLRGRGGQLAVANSIAETLGRIRRPVALLIDRNARSAKEVLAFKLMGASHVRLVGERTAGAVLPARLRPLGRDIMVMLPADRPGRARRWVEKFLRGGDEDLIWGRLEGKGVPPDIPAARPGPYSEGFDPILEAGVRDVIKRLRLIPGRRRF